MVMTSEYEKFAMTRKEAKDALTDFVILACLAQDPNAEKGKIFDKSTGVVDAIADMVIAKLEMEKRIMQMSKK